jgi:adenosine deaminase
MRYNPPMSEPSREFLERMPKIELHVHLEGAVPRPALDELARKYGRPVFTALLDGGRGGGGGTRPRSLPAGEYGGNGTRLRLRFASGYGKARSPENLRGPSFADFVDVWLKIGDLMREYEDYTFIARALSADLKRRNILYAEVLFSPARDSTAHLQPDRIAEAVAAGFAEGPASALVRDSNARPSAAETDPRKNPGGPAAAPTAVRLIADFVRDNGPREAGRALDSLLAMNERMIAGIGIGGWEAPYPPAPFAPVFERARASGLRTQAHAGESAGPESVWAAIRELRVDRIAHGVRAREDAALLTYLKESGLPLDICPTSNVRTGAVKDIADHPAADFLRRGLKINLSTDDPTLFGADLAGEFELLVRTFGLERNEIRALLLNAADAAWCDAEEKRRLRRAVESFFSRP